MTTPTKVTIKWHQDTMYVWPDNIIKHVRVVNDVVQPHGYRDYKTAAWMLLGRLELQQQIQLRAGFVMVVDGTKLLEGLRY